MQFLYKCVFLLFLFIAAPYAVTAKFVGVQAVLKEKKALFQKVDSCQPILRWSDFNVKHSKKNYHIKYKKDFQSYPKSYDVVLVEALKIDKIGKFTHAAGDLVFSRYDIKGNEVQVNKPLDPQSTYYWNIRLKLGDEYVFPWSSHQRSGLFGESYNGFPYGIITPEKC